MRDVINKVLYGAYVQLKKIDNNDDLEWSNVNAVKKRMR